MSDGQTDKQQRAFNWAVTAFNNDILILEDEGRYPPFVERVYGGREICKETGREHFQGHICLRSGQRMSALKKWLPTAHLGVARNFKASVTYAMKADTASGVKKEAVNPNPPMPNNQEALMMLARVEAKAPPVVDAKNNVVISDDKDFWFRVKVILREQPNLCGLFGKPDIYRLWKHTWEVWCEYATEESIVLQTPIILSPENINAPGIQEASDEEEGASQEASKQATGEADRTQ